MPQRLLNKSIVFFFFYKDKGLKALSDKLASFASVASLKTFRAAFFALIFQEFLFSEENALKSAGRLANSSS